MPTEKEIQARVDRYLKEAESEIPIEEEWRDFWVLQRAIRKAWKDYQSADTKTEGAGPALKQLLEMSGTKAVILSKKIH